MSPQRGRHVPKTSSLPQKKERRESSPNATRCQYTAKSREEYSNHRKACLSVELGEHDDHEDEELQREKSSPMQNKLAQQHVIGAPAIPPPKKNKSVENAGLQIPLFEYKNVKCML